MPKSNSRRAIEGRKWRVSARQKRRLNTIVTEYVRLKHETIYEECLNLYNSIKKNYSENQNLTKTEEFRELVGHCMQEDEPTVDEPTVDEPTVDEPTVDEPANTVDEPASNAADELPNNTVGVEPAAAEERVMEPVHHEVVSIGDTYVEPDLILNSYIVQHHPDILSEAINEMLGQYDVLDRTEDIEAIVNEIVNDLEAVDPNIFINSAEDEGIGLNIEDEVDDPFHDIDIDLDAYDY